MRFPACRSPWKVPAVNAESNNVSIRVFTTSGPSNPASRIASASSILMPSTYSMVSTLSVQRSE
ncbi:Uncharacterised protein [Mycobacteroides abscessus subsp. abscessus]|nr:Uncharacterised protein [Mycobacteroides abscessus subsp. abscessus]